MLARSKKCLNEKRKIMFSCNFPKKPPSHGYFLIPGYPCKIPGYWVPSKYPGIGYPGMGSAVSMFDISPNKIAKVDNLHIPDLPMLHFPQNLTQNKKYSYHVTYHVTPKSFEQFLHNKAKRENRFSGSSSVRIRNSGFLMAPA